MKTSLSKRKTMLVLLLLAFSLLLTGCNLVVKDQEVDARQVILEVNGETMDKARFAPVLQNALDNDYNQQAQMYQQYGLPATQIRQDRAQIMSDTLDATALDMLLHQKAHELKLDELTEEETSKLEEEAQASYQQILDLVKNIYFQNSELDEAALNAAVEKQAGEFGYSRELFIQSAKEGNLHDKLHEYAGRDVTVNDEEVQAEYDRLVNENKEKYQADPAAYGTDLINGSAVYYAPAGYRYVRQVLIKLEDTDVAAINALENERNNLNNAVATAQGAVNEYETLLASETLSEEGKALLNQQAESLGEDAARYQELLASESPTEEEIAFINAQKAKLPLFVTLSEAQDAAATKEKELADLRAEALEKILPKAQEVYTKATEENVSFDALIEVFNQDTGMPAEGYAVSADTTSFVESFKQAAMALEKVGDISQPVESSYGYHVLAYASDIPEGAVSKESVAEGIKASVLASKQEAYYHELEEQWLQEADIKKYPERMDN